MKDIFSTELFPKVALLFKIIKRKYKDVPTRNNIIGWLVYYNP